MDDEPKLATFRGIPGNTDTTILQLYRTNTVLYGWWGEGEERGKERDGGRSREQTLLSLYKLEHSLQCMRAAEA